MALPDSRKTLVAGPLAGVSIAYRNSSYIADRVFPIIDNCPMDAQIARYLKGAWFRDEAGIMGPGVRAPRGGYPTDYVPISVKKYGFAKEVTEEDRLVAEQQGAPPLQPETDAIEFATDKVDLKKEIRVAALIFGSTWCSVSGGTDLHGTWAAGDGNTFIADVETKIELIRSLTGRRPNRLMMTANILPEIKRESTVLDRIKYTERGIVTAALIAAMFDLQEVLIGDAIKSTAKESKAGTDFTNQNVWEKNSGKGSAFLYYTPDRPGLKTPSAGYQARTNFRNGVSRRTRTWYEEAEDQDVYEVAERTDILQTGDDLGYLWVDCIAD